MRAFCRQWSRKDSKSNKPNGTIAQYAGQLHHLHDDHATRSFSQDEQSVACTRSATEASLYRRLETLPETVGEFHLNTKLNTPFDECGLYGSGLVGSNYSCFLNSLGKGK